MLSWLDRTINRLTMYSLTLYVLAGLEIIAIVLSSVGLVHYQTKNLVVSLIAISLTCYLVNKAFGFIFKVSTNRESWLITALILALILPPYSGGTLENLTFLLAASALAMASKYIFNYKGSHIFNPAAVAVALTAIGPRQAADWWVGTASMLPFVVLGGLILVRRIGRGRMVAIFFAAALISTIFYSRIDHLALGLDLKQTLTTSSLFFLGFIMLTEPMTSPRTEPLRDVYALIVGLLFPPQFHILSLYSTPELALLVGNFFSFNFSPKTKYSLSLKEKLRLTPDSLDFVFQSPNNLQFKPGQYLEWSLPHSQTDTRGGRRYFSLASSPTESELRIGVKFYQKGSSYKNALMHLEPESKINIDQLAGDFTLPKNKRQKIVLIAGGIGITPYRSMLKYLIDKNERRDLVLLYSASTRRDLAYLNVIEEARKQLGVKVYYFLTNDQFHQKSSVVFYRSLSGHLISQLVPDYADRLFYVSGTPSMVKSISQQLKKLGLKKSQIKVDNFSGY